MCSSVSLSESYPAQLKFNRNKNHMRVSVAIRFSDFLQSTLLTSSLSSPSFYLLSSAHHPPLSPHLPLSSSFTRLTEGEDNPPQDRDLNGDYFLLYGVGNMRGEYIT